MVHERVGIGALPVVRQSRGNQARDYRLLPVTRVIGEHYTQQPTPRIAFCLSDARTNLPVNVFALPSARADEHDGNRCISYVFVANLLSDCRCLQTRVVNVAGINRSVNDSFSHHANKGFFAPDILFVKADEHSVSGCIGGHFSSPS